MTTTKSLHAIIGQIPEHVRPMVAVAAGESPDALEAALAVEAEETMPDVTFDPQKDADFSEEGPHWLLAWRSANGCVVGLECGGKMFEGVEPEDALGCVYDHPTSHTGGWLWAGLARDSGLGGLDTRGVWRQATPEEMAVIGGGKATLPRIDARMQDIKKVLIDSGHGADDVNGSDWGSLVQLLVAMGRRAETMAEVAYALGAHPSTRAEQILLKVSNLRHGAKKLAELGAWISNKDNRVTVGEHAVDAAIRLLDEAEVQRRDLSSARMVLHAIKSAAAPSELLTDEAMVARVAEFRRHSIVLDQVWRIFRDEPSQPGEPFTPGANSSLSSIPVTGRALMSALGDISKALAAAKAVKS